MKYFLLIFLAISCRHPQEAKNQISKLHLNYLDKKNDLKRNHLKGKVKKVTSHFFPLQYKRDIDVDKPPFIEKGAENSTLVDLYNKSGNNVEDSSKTTVSKSFFDINGYRLKTYVQVFISGIYPSNSGDVKMFYKNDKNGNVLEEICYDYHDSISCIVIYNYDSINIVKSFQYGSDKSLISEQIDKYDNPGNLIERHSYGVMPENRTFKYDSDGNEIEEESFSVGGRRKDKTKWTLSNFDKNSNALKEMISVNDEPSTLIEKVIEYY